MGGTKDLRAIQNSIPRGSVQCSEPSVVPESERNGLQCELGFGRPIDTDFGSLSKWQRRTDYRNQQPAASGAAGSEVCVLAPLSILGIGAVMDRPYSKKPESSFCYRVSAKKSQRCERRGGVLHE